jgi:hypothetical protein
VCRYDGILDDSEFFIVSCSRRVIFYIVQIITAPKFCVSTICYRTSLNGPILSDSVVALTSHVSASGMLEKPTVEN